ncbi:uncharacterized protein LOC108217114 [Daucus carota subsp. sativus]|uniref:DUF674 family protein n=1 Tax=Daucus carota subsp. sativus TaxID=79200 RepID=A0A162A763_DAUCS|nr:PREDICTED: uncharacterized protein LOC108217114 [Daucus carota subsp. sativus]
MPDTFLAKSPVRMNDRSKGKMLKRKTKNKKQTNRCNSVIKRGESLKMPRLESTRRPVELNNIKHESQANHSDILDAMKQVKFQLKLFVEKERNRVVFAEAGSDFIDTFFSFLTLPMGTIVRILNNNLESESRVIGSFSTLYTSVKNLDSGLLWSDECKQMLLSPRNSAEADCLQLKLNLDDSAPGTYFICEDWGCSRNSSAFLSTYCTTRCSCGKLMNRGITVSVTPNVKNVQHKGGVFAREIESYIESPLTEAFLCDGADRVAIIQSKVGSLADTQTCRDRETTEDAMTIKLIVQKSSNKVLFALAEKNFEEFLFSFLTIPLGGITRLLSGNISVGSVSNLYQSVSSLNSKCNIKSQEVKMLLNFQLAPLHFCKNQIFCLNEAKAPLYYCLSDKRYAESIGCLVEYRVDCNYELKCTPLTLKNPKFEEEYARSNEMFMVTDDLVVSPFSAIASISIMQQLKIYPSDVEEQVVRIGMEEALKILKASFESTAALTNAFSSDLLLKKQLTKEEH